MTKLEEKLIELGYVEDKCYSNVYKKIENKNIFIIRLNYKNRNKIDYICIENAYYIETQQDIDHLQQAFNQLQNDLEVLKEYE